MKGDILHQLRDRLQQKSDEYWNGWKLTDVKICDVLFRKI